MKRIAILSAIHIKILLLCLAQAQNPIISAIKETGLPFVQNFSAKEYNAHQQNWAIVQDKRGVMYFGNLPGVLEYDGVLWRVIPIPNKSVVRSLAIDSTGCIYVGAHGELGYLAADSIGEMRYNSLLDRIRPENQKFNNVWKVHATPKGVFFRTNTHVFLWSNDMMRVWKPSTEFHRSFWVHDTFYVREWDVGLMQLVDDSLQLAPGGSTFAVQRVDVMLPFDDDKILLGTRTEGLFLYDDAFTQRFDTEADSFLKDNHLYDGVILPNGMFALATLRGGVIVIDLQGHCLMRLDKSSGLQDNTVWSVSTDRQGALWLALNKGLARVETPSALSLYKEKLGIEGSVESIQRQGVQLYAATGLGVYYLQSSSEAGTPPSFQPITGIATQAWSLLSTGKTLLAATSNGVYSIEGNRAIQVTDLLSFSLFNSKRDSNRVYVGLVDGLGMLQFANGKWSFIGRLPGITEEVRSIAEDEAGDLWLGSQFQGVLKVQSPPLEFLHDTQEQAIEIERYGQQSDLPDGEVNVYLINRRIVFGTERGLKQFNPQKRSFVPDTTLGKTFADSLYSVWRIAEDKRGDVWIAGGRAKVIISALSRQSNGTYRLMHTPLRRMADFGHVWAIYPDRARSNVVWLGGDEGIVRYDSDFYKDTLVNYQALVRRVEVNGDSLIFGGTSVKSNREASTSYPILAYTDNALRFEFAAPSYDDQAANQFQYFLEGFDKAWSDWTKSTAKEYTNLPAGQYIFRIRAKNIHGTISSEDKFGFEILEPWYWSWWAYATYLVLFVATVYVVDRVQRSRLIKQEIAKAKLREAEIINQKNVELNEKNEQLEFVLQKLQSAQDSLIGSESRFRAVAESANDAIMTSDITGKITFWNKHAETMFGYSEKEAVGQLLTILMPDKYHKAHREGLDRFLRTGKARIIGKVVELEAIRKDGNEFPIELTLASWETHDGKFVTGIIRDITRRKQEQAELEATQVWLFQSEKLASLGKLTAGIAHEINTPLGAIKSNADVASRCVGKLEAILEKNNTSTAGIRKDEYMKIVKLLRENSQISATASDRISKIINSLKNFSRLDEAEYQRIDLNKSIESTLTLIENEMKQQICVVKEFGDIPPVECHPGELNQVFMNLLTNAAQSITAKGTITIRSFVEKDDVHIQITDTGIGIAPEQLKSLFDPGFTSKGSRVKTGLGLYISYNLIQKHRGQITVQSEVGKGSTFSVILPLSVNDH
jgi:PAS domain S-box-containing protein